MFGKRFYIDIQSCVAKEVLHMRRNNRKRKPLLNEETKCVIVLSSDEENDEDKAEYVENKQLRRINEFAKINNLIPVAIVRRGIMGRMIYNQKYKGAIEYMKQGKASAIVCTNLESISYGEADSYYRVGLVREAGFRLFTVDEKEPFINLYKAPKKKGIM